MSDPREELPEPAERRSPRHAAPRTPVRLRLRGRALAMAAVPTALLMAATYTPNPAIAETAASKPCATAPDAPPKVVETPVPKSELPPPIPGPSVPIPEAPATTAPEPTAAPAAGPTTVPAAPPVTAPAETVPAAPTTAPAAGTTAPEPAATKARTAGGGGVVQAGLIGDIVGGVTDLLLPGGTPSPTATASPAAGTRAVAPAAPAPAASGSASPARTGGPSTAPSTGPTGTPAGTAAPTAPGTTAPGTTAPTSPKPTAAPTTGAPATGGTAPSASASAKASGKASAKPAAGSATATPSASGTPSKDPNCLVDTKALSPAGKPPDNPILVPDQNWTLQTSRLTLNHAVLLGVVNVQTPTGTKRVLKFEVETVDIENLHMTTLQGNGKTFHVKGAPGSVSTMRQGPVTMYVERLSGHLAKVLGLPIPIDLGELTLTPDGPLPQWLYDLIGQLQLPLWIELTGVTAIQSGQFGGTLKIPGMKLYNDDQPYPGAA
ncbi:hypothetical protein ACIPYS_10180 [Kitasatospora sp. NPDC089913]|uniref:hypothetical protein n=1 Tax=Streptomycetaceae TaxID=2062 RepID=UPI00087B1D9F|nr:hypothetical protein [Streptomyces sp. TLI_053]SDT59879.1 hypothetical protein SAMN05216371_3066 [Streptomyces sp. TLI_053]